MSIEELVFEYKNAKTSEKYTEQDRVNFTRAYDATKPYFPALVKLARKRFGAVRFSDCELNGIIDEVFMRVAEGYEGRGAKFTTVLTISFFNAIFSRIRNEKRRENKTREFFSRKSQRYVEDPSVDLETVDYANYLLGKLEPAQQRVVNLYSRGFNFPEIANMTGRPTSKGRISVSYRNAIERLRRVV